MTVANRPRGLWGVHVKAISMKPKIIRLYATLEQEVQIIGYTVLRVAKKVFVFEHNQIHRG